MARYEVYAALLVVTAFVFVVTGIVVFLKDSARDVHLQLDPPVDEQVASATPLYPIRWLQKVVKPVLVPPAPSAPVITSTAKKTNSAAAPQYKSRFQLMQQDTLQDALVAPKPQIRSPLIVSHDLQYKFQHKKYTFQSQQRDVLQYPSPAVYRVQLLVPLRNVVAITLSAGVFPITEFNVNPYNNKLDFRVGATVYTVVLPEGEYTPATLVADLQTAITSLGPPLALFTVTLDPLTGKVIIANAAPFDLLFRSGPSVNESLWQVLGFYNWTTHQHPLHFPSPRLVSSTCRAHLPSTCL